MSEQHINSASAGRSSGDLYRLLFESHPNPMWFYDLETLRFLAVNDAAVRHYGYTREEFLNLTIADIRPLEDVPDMLASVSEPEHDATTYERLWRHRKRDGTLIVVQITGQTFPFAGHPAELILAQDVTAQQLTQQQLRESEARYRTLIEHAHDAITILEHDGRVRYESPAVERMTGFKSAENIGKHILEFVHPEDVPAMRDELNYKLRHPGEVVTFACRVKHLDGTWRFIEGTGVNLLHHPAVRGIVANTRDVTEQRRVEEQLRQAQKMEAIGRLAGGVAHDFNNLLTAITGYSDLLLRRDDMSATARNHVEQIRRAADRAASLTRQLLAFSRKQMLNVRVINLNTTVDEIEDMLRRLVGEQATLETRLAADLCNVEADSLRMEQVVINLVSNARDACADGGSIVIATRNLEVTEQSAARRLGLEPAHYCVLSVSDTGCGMDGETSRRAFEPFFTTKEQGKGTGLGLSTVYGIVKQSGGHIEVESAPGRGATFSVYLPRSASATTVAAPPPRDAAAPSITQNAAQDAGNDVAGADDAAHGLRGTETLLLVEDEEIVRQMAGEVLRGYGYAVLEAAGGQAALEICRDTEKRIDLMLTDVMMPGMNGAELAHLAARLRPALKTLYMSGYADEWIVSHGVLDAGVAFIHKPWTPAALAAKVREALDGE